MKLYPLSPKRQILIFLPVNLLQHSPNQSPIHPGNLLCWEPAMLGTSEPIGVVKNMIPTNSTLQGLVAFLAGPTDNILNTSKLATRRHYIKAYDRAKNR